MRQTTYNKIKQAYKRLRENNSDILKFRNFEEMLEEVEELQQEVSGSPDGWWLTRRTASKPFEPGNLALIEIQSEECLDYLIYPSY